MSGSKRRRLFLQKGYDEKRAMIEELQKPISLAFIMQEINRYADSEFRYSDKSDEAAIEALDPVITACVRPLRSASMILRTTDAAADRRGSALRWFAAC